MKFRITVNVINKMLHLEEFQTDFLNTEILQALLNCQSLKIVKFLNQPTPLDKELMNRHPNIQFIKTNKFFL